MWNCKWSFHVLESNGFGKGNLLEVSSIDVGYVSKGVMDNRAWIGSQFGVFGILNFV